MTANGRKTVLGVIVATALAGSASQAYWQTVFEEDFSDTGTSTWFYEGVTNEMGEALFRVDSVNGRVGAEWCQTNWFQGGRDPYIIRISHLRHPLGLLFTDRHTFRVGVTLRLTSGSIPETDRGYQVANFGLYNCAEMGPDRTSSDWDSTNSVLVKDGSDYVEFNYFIGNAWSGRSICPAIGAHETNSAAANFPTWWGVSGDPDWPRNYIGTHALPYETNLYLELTYYGGATNGRARRAYAAVYTEAARTNIMEIEGNTVEWWTPPLDEDSGFTLTDVAFYNYVDNTNYAWVTGPPARGEGTFDDLYVQRHVDDGEVFDQSATPEGMVVSFGAASGTAYIVQSCPLIRGGIWVTNAVLESSGETLSYTNPINGESGFTRVLREVSE